MILKSETLLQETKLLDFSNKDIQTLIHSRRWNELDDFNKIKTYQDYGANDRVTLGYI